MSQKFLDNITLWALFLVAISDVVLFLLEDRKQRQASEQEQSEEKGKKELLAVHNEINLLKIQLEKLKK